MDLCFPTIKTETLILIPTGKIPLVDGFVPSRNSPLKETMLSNENHDWEKPMEQGPSDIGFSHSYVSLAGLQNPPYVFLRNNIVDMDLNRISFWPIGNFSMPHGLSIIEKQGEGAEDWDSTAYNMILVNETEQFLELVSKHKIKAIY